MKWILTFVLIAVSACQGSPTSEAQPFSDTSGEAVASDDNKNPTHSAGAITGGNQSSVAKAEGDDYRKVASLVDDAEMYAESCAKYGSDDPQDNSCQNLRVVEEALVQRDICYGIKGGAREYYQYHSCEPSSLAIDLDTDIGM